jgi:N-acetylmuramoyl-L-alanine amidase
LETWQGSGEHNAILLGDGFGAIGIGRAYDPASAYGWYWTAIFADENDGPGWLCGEAAPPSKTVSLFQSVDGAISESDVNLRSGPGLDYAVVTTLPVGTSMTVTGREMQAYLPVKVDGQYGWVGAEWVERGAITLEQPAAPSETGGPGTATAVDAVELRNAPAESGGVLATIPGVAVVTLTGEAQDGFLGVVYEGQEGWANASYLAVAEMAPGTVLLQPAGAPVPDGAATAEMAPAPATASTVGTQAIATVDVNLRAQPSPDALVLSVVPAGSPVSLTGSQANGYANVRIEGQAGWIDTAYLQ